jgi:hypothetical protein
MRVNFVDSRMVPWHETLSSDCDYTTCATSLTAPRTAPEVSPPAGRPRPRARPGRLGLPYCAADQRETSPSSKSSPKMNGEPVTVTTVGTEVTVPTLLLTSTATV